MCQLRVYIPSHHKQCESDSVHPEVDSAISIFIGDSSFFDVDINVYKPDPCDDLDLDYQIVKEALEMSAEFKDESYTIICKDTSIATASSQQILNLIESVVKMNQDHCDKDFDILWLADWLDRCDLFTNIQKIGGRGAYVADTVSPHGIQCLLFSPKGREKFLMMEPVKSGAITLSGTLNRRTVLRNNSESSHECTPRNVKFKSRVIQPCPVSFDSSRAKSDVEYAKCSACADPPGPVKPNKTGSDIGFFIFIVIGIVIIAAIAILIKFGNNISDRLSRNVVSAYTSQSTSNVLSPGSSETFSTPFGSPN